MPRTQAWKRRRLAELGFDSPEWLRFVPVNFESDLKWLGPLEAAGFDARRPAVITSTGVSMYLTTEAIARTLREIATLAPGSTFAMTFLVPFELADPEIRPALEMAVRGARESGTPFISTSLRQISRNGILPAGPTAFALRTTLKRPSWHARNRESRRPARSGKTFAAISRYKARILLRAP